MTPTPAPPHTLLSLIIVDDAVTPPHHPPALVVLRSASMAAGPSYGELYAAAEARATPARLSTRHRGVTQHTRTGRFETHRWHGSRQACE